MHKFLLACAVATLSLSAAPLWAAPTRGESVADLVMSGDFKGALKAVDQWKAAKGEADPEYWLATAVVHYKLAGDAPPTLDREVHYDAQKVRVATAFLDEGVRRFPYRYDLWSMRVEFAKGLHDSKAEIDALTSLATGPKPKNGKFETEGGQPLLPGPYAEMCVTELNTAARDHLSEKTAAGDQAGRQIAELLIKLFPKAAEGYNALGAALERSGDKPGAIALYQRVVAMKGNPLQVEVAKDRLEELKAPAAKR